MNEHPATLLRCVVERITYQNPENGYSVLKVKVKGYNDLVTLVGNLLEVPVGSVLLCRGEWKVDKRYGSQFVAATWEETMPATVYGIEKYLGSDLIRKLEGGNPVHIQDALIGETAIKNALTVITNDDRFKKRIAAQGGQALTTEEFLKVLKEPDA